MMMLLFTVKGDLYGLDVSQVVEIIPCVDLKEIPRTPKCVAGLFMYRGRAVPVIDISLMLSGATTQKLLSTRIVLINYPVGGEQFRVVGVLAEHATETISVKHSDFIASALGDKDEGFVDYIVMNNRGMIQRINVDRIFPASLHALIANQAREYDQLSEMQKWT